MYIVDDLPRCCPKVQKHIHYSPFMHNGHFSWTYNNKNDTHNPHATKAEDKIKHA